MTALTIQWACQKSVNSERSEEVSGSTDCATSAGFMGTSFPLSGSNQSNRRGAQCSDQYERAAEVPLTRSTANRMFRENRQVPPPAGLPKSPRNLAKLGRRPGLSALNSADCG